MNSKDLTPPIEPTKSPTRYNALKHGIFSVSPVIPFFEDEDDWLEFRDSIFESQHPAPGLEAALVDRSAAILWRIMRTLRYEREVITAGLLDVRKDIEARELASQGHPAGELTPQRKEKMERWAMHRLLPGDSDLNKIMRYETKMHRFLLQTLHQLHSMRAAPKPPRNRTDIEHTDIRRIGVRAPRIRPPAPHH